MNPYIQKLKCGLYDAYEKVALLEEVRIGAALAVELGEENA